MSALSAVSAPGPAFLMASFVLAVLPGPGIAFIVTCTLGEGRRNGLVSVAGVALGNLGNALGAALGLAALLAVSATAFTAVKLAGAAYLVFLGAMALRRRDAGAIDAVASRLRSRAAAVFRDGFLVALLNPKTALFFAAFLPQFIDPGVAALPQVALLGAVFVAVAAATDTAYVLAAGTVARAFGAGRRRAATRYATAATYIGLGFYAAFGDLRAAR
ncbi:MAG: LysE family translocator [Caldimonas sp.]